MSDAGAAARGLSGSADHLLFLHTEGGLLLAAARSQGVELWDVATERVIRVVHKNLPAEALAALPDDTDPDVPELLLVGGPDGTVWTFHPVTGAMLGSQKISGGAVRDIAVSPAGADDPDGPVVVVAHSDGVAVWRPRSRVTQALPADPQDSEARPFRVCTYVRGGNRFAICAYTNGYLAVWNLSAPEAMPRWQQAHAGPIWSLISVQDPPGGGGPIVVSGGSDRTMRVFEPDAAGVLTSRQLYLADGTIRRLGHAVDDSVSLLVTASADGSVSLWRHDGPAERPLLVLALHAGEVYSVACDTVDDRVVVASGDFNGRIQINRLSSAVLVDRRMRPAFRTDGTIWAVASGVSEAGPFLACAGVNQLVHVVDQATGNLRATLSSHRSTIRSLTFGGTAEDAHLVSGGADHRVLDWDPNTGMLRAELPMGHEAEVWALTTATHKGALYAISGGPDGTARMCDLAAPTTSVVLARECGEVASLTVVRDGERTFVVLGSSQGLLRVSLDEPGRREFIATHAVSATCLVSDRNRQLVVATRADGSVDMFDPLRGTLVGSYAMPLPSRQVRAVAAYSNAAGETVVFGGCDNGEVLKWRIDGRLIGRPSHGGSTSVRSLRVVAQPGPGGGAALLSGSHDGTLRMWPISPDTPLATGGTLQNPVRAASILLQDQPADSDLLARHALTKTIVSALQDSATIAPVVIGVHAPWGQGKSSVLRQIRASLDPYHSDGDGFGSPLPGAGATPGPTHRLVSREPGGGEVDTKITPVWAWRRLQDMATEKRLPYALKPDPQDEVRPISIWFNPWMYERPEHIWAGLTREILTTVTGRLPDDQRRRLFFDLNLRRTQPADMRRQLLRSYLPHSLRSILVLAISTIAIIAATVGLVAAMVNSGQLANIIGTGAAVTVIALGVVAKVLFSASKGFRTWYNPTAVAGPSMGGASGQHPGGNGARDPLEATDRGLLYLLQHDVREVVQLAGESSPLYIFIDDLDRCSAAIVADTVEAINLFLTKMFSPCVFILAVDPATVAAHLETARPSLRQRAMDDPVSFGHLRHTGWRFMEKIVDLPVRLPRIPDAAIANYLSQLLNVSSGPVGGGADAGGGVGGTAKGGSPSATVLTPGSVPAPRMSRPSTASSFVGSVPSGGAKKSPSSNGSAVPTPPPTTTPTPAAAAVRAPEAAGVPEPDGTRLVGRMEDVPIVREALNTAVLNLPGRNPRQTKAFINLWRFYMVLDFELGHMTNNLTATKVHSAEMARFVEIMVRWPWLLDALGARRLEGNRYATAFEELARAAPAESKWREAATSVRMDPDDEATIGLQMLLARPGTDTEVLISIAGRYL